MSNNSDIVGVWHVPLSDGVHKVEFEHGTASGKRVVRVNDKEVYREDWMFKLVGEQEFSIGAVPCVVKIEPISGFSYCYSLVVDGKPLEEFTKKWSTMACTWTIGDHRIVLEKDTLDIWVDGTKVEATGEFVDGGTETHFPVGEDFGCIKSISSCNKREGMIYTLIYKNQIIPQENES
ncbi:fas apoptotic inhibitory molecule 1 isoform X2 [Cimex lectularius]|uniref:Fas apoptotic inhibitory molecule n=1 Tax=Cimex lectularius TaxID=79782 RepID=A0A8I6RPD9_CIMLE|nr:fas apoptotic inhibitory molecule 1 isoform X2 [Cimex lectularius]